MSETGLVWEYCQIDFQVIDDGRDPGHSSHKLMWVQFRAVTEGENGRSIIARSEKMPMPNMLGAGAYAPQKENLGHTNMHAIFVQSLQDDGWELLQQRGGEWWQRRLRRPVVEKQSLFGKIAAVFTG